VTPTHLSREKRVEAPPTRADNVLEIRDLCKSFAGLKAVDNVSFSL
jgi:ABC-type uncharacterized transport system ATPase subunit